MISIMCHAVTCILGACVYDMNVHLYVSSSHVTIYLCHVTSALCHMTFRWHWEQGEGAPDPGLDGRVSEERGLRRLGQRSQELVPPWI